MRSVVDEFRKGAEDYSDDEIESMVDATTFIEKVKGK
jgi:hypothetical protein